MEKSVIKHYEDNKEVFDMWIRENSRLQPSMDILQPFIKVYPHNINGCQDCLIDMLIWIKIEIKKTHEDATTNKKTK